MKNITPTGANPMSGRKRRSGLVHLNNKYNSKSRPFTLTPFTKILQYCEVILLEIQWKL